ncbi:MAG: hypothetical protein R3E01_35045 [Pirellulaceae bacterium]|nr:hypothetical protein [Planctomycetales bacterium]
MKSLNWLSVSSLFVVVFTSSSVRLPPCNAQEVESEDLEVRISQAIADAMPAENAKEGLAGAQERNASAVARGDFPFTMITVASNEVLWLASGSASYGTQGDNVTATRNRMKYAIDQAYAQARKNLLIGLRGVRSSLESQSMSDLEVTTDDKADRVKMSRIRDEVLRQSLSETLTHASVHEYHIDGNRVVVSVKASTQPAVHRVADGYVEANSITSAVQHLVTESELLPAAGVRLVSVADQGDAVIGYGAHVVAINADGVVQTELIENAKRIATAKARSSIVGFLAGEKVDWSTETISHFKESVPEIADNAMDDPSVGEQPLAGVEKRAMAEQRFLSTVQTKETLAIVTEGRLPPGVLVRTWYNAELGVCHAMALYYRPITDRVGKLDNTTTAHSGDLYRSVEGITTPSRTFRAWPSGRESDILTRE